MFQRGKRYVEKVAATKIWYSEAFLRKNKQPITSQKSLVEYMEV